MRFARKLLQLKKDTAPIQLKVFPVDKKTFDIKSKQWFFLYVHKKIELVISRFLIEHMLRNVNLMSKYRKSKLVL